MRTRYRSWGHYPPAEESALPLYWRTVPLPIPAFARQSYLPFGNGRSYGDVCLNNGGLLLDTRRLDRFISFDPAAGILRCESGILLAEILAATVPRGWFLPVVPGTKLVTVGGAIANDIHGKNHHSSGTFGHHVRCLELARSDGRRLVCSPQENPEWFHATVGGLGLTGVILWAEIALKRIDNPMMVVETIRYKNLDEFFALSRESDKKFEYTVAWVDSTAKEKHRGRGLFIRANHAAPGVKQHSPPRFQARLPIDIPISLVNGLSAKLFNIVYYRKQFRAHRTGECHYEPFFFPLDRLLHWNRIYGPQGFHQYQCLLPLSADGRNALRDILSHGAGRGIECFLSVLKVFGNQRSCGLLSFPRAGVTVTLDIGHRGESSLRLLEDFDTIVRSVGGSVYPAKDARMSSSSFRQYYPRYQDLEQFRDPLFNSSFWRRVTGF